MYNPEAFRVEAAAAIADFIDAHPFATLVTVSDGLPVVTHLPLELERNAGDRGTLIGHMARANPHWKRLEGAPTVAVFHGPHAYVSPSWYERHPAVPTWNYAVVHAAGTAQLLSDDAQTGALLDRMVRRHEEARSEPWVADLPDVYRARMTASVVGFALPIQTIEGKFKLSQNRSPADRRGVLEGLAQEGAPDSAALAEFMHVHLASTPVESEGSN